MNHADLALLSPEDRRMRVLGLTYMALAAAITISTSVSAQSIRGGFVATLGNDTVHAERFTGDAKSLSGTIVMRSPALRVIKWTMSLDADGKPARYEANAVDAVGAPVLSGHSGSMTFAADTIVREAFRAGEREIQRLAAPERAYPA